MNKNWNVYKTFKNGKRAKLPSITFEAETECFFFENILPTLEMKLQKIKWEIIDAEKSQERGIKGFDQEKILKKRQAEILSELTVEKMPHLRKKNVVGCLMMNKQTNWKWAWCTAESASSKFLATLSPMFNCRKDADEWMNQKIETSSLWPKAAG